MKYYPLFLLIFSCENVLANEIKVFESGQAIKAADMNANFMALKSEIEMLKQQLNESTKDVFNYQIWTTETILESGYYYYITDIIPGRSGSVSTTPNLEISGMSTILFPESGVATYSASQYVSYGSVHFNTPLKLSSENTLRMTTNGHSANIIGYRIKSEPL
ncbi:hypothetical protein [Paraferrimonas sp. SM1919]|uniref:hypothetical protein n=1 Tax=Paraferrimonas sp. SM1919 TaxID=2662263 RepID=UPI0013D7A806|nr:hypothetical protein [Paraferrimonas sp. SM1919]